MGWLIGAIAALGGIGAIAYGIRRWAQSRASKRTGRLEQKVEVLEEAQEKQQRAAEHLTQPRRTGSALWDSWAKRRRMRDK